jgi:hypothetical protein
MAPEMYRNCLFCKHSLGQNKTLEFLSVGRRVAFDRERGRLWVVCPMCGRWNLCPFDERSEALEECVRLSEAALLQEASGEIALLQHRHGLSMIRVGKPPLSELVSWRYARSLVRRRRAFLASGAALGAASGLMFVGMAAGWAVAVPLMGTVGGFYPLVEMRRTVLEFSTAEGVDLECTAPMARGVCLRHDPGGQVSLRVRTKNAGYQDVQGEDAGILLARAMPYINETGGTTDSAILAARSITEQGGVAGFLSALAQDSELQRSSVLRAVGGHPRREGAVYRYPKPLQLALEAASHIRQEDRFLSGEFRRTLVEWRSAEEEAAISDSLLEPEGWTDFKRVHLSDGRDKV